MEEKRITKEFWINYKYYIYSVIHFANKLKIIESQFSADY